MLALSIGFVALVASFIPSTYAAYTVTTEPWQTDRPIPGSTVFYDIQFGATDPTLVDILLVNASQGNTTVIFGNSNLSKKDDANAGFDVPFCPPGKYAIRLVETSSKRFLADSSQFDIFAPGTTTPSPSSPSSTPTSTPTATPTGISGGSQVTPPPSTSKSTPIGPIVGGVIGGLVLIAAVIAALFICRRRGRRLVTGAANEKYTPLRKNTPKTGDIQPFKLEPRVDPESDIVSNYPGGSSLATGTTMVGRSAGPLPTKSRANLENGYGVGIGPGNGASSSAFSLHAPEMPSSPISASSINAISRADQLRLERERINHEIAALEGRTNVSGSNGTTSITASSGPGSSSGGRSRMQSEDQGDIAAQVAALRDHIRQMEARQTQYGTTVHDADFEPPPGYDGPPTTSPALPLQTSS